MLPRDQSTRLERRWGRCVSLPLEVGKLREPRCKRTDFVHARHDQASTNNEEQYAKRFNHEHRMDNCHGRRREEEEGGRGERRPATTSRPPPPTQNRCTCALLCFVKETRRREHISVVGPLLVCCERQVVTRAVSARCFPDPPDKRKLAVGVVRRITAPARWRRG